MSAGLLISLVFGAIFVAVGILVAVMVWKKRKEGKFEEPDYRAFFIMGAIIFPASIFFIVMIFTFDIPFIVGMPLFAVGLIFLIIGLANRDKWKKNR